MGSLLNPPHPSGYCVPDITSIFGTWEAKIFQIPHATLQTTRIAPDPRLFGALDSQGTLVVLTRSAQLSVPLTEVSPASPVRDA